MWDKFTNQYPLSKTLRFELKPVGETEDYLENFKSDYLKSVVKQDSERGQHYKEVKEIIDDYHRAYIEEKLSTLANPETGELHITPADIEDAFSYFQNLRDNSRDLEARKAWEDVQAGLRQKLVKAFDGNSELFKKELITRNLPTWLKEKGLWEQHQEAIESFNNFTTYFTGFHENRKNMYTHEAQSTAISFRLINENLPRFFINCLNYSSIQEKHGKLDLSANSDLLDRMNASSVDEIFRPRYFPSLATQTGIDNFQTLLGGKVLEDGTKIQGLNEQINLYRQKESLKARELPVFTGLYKQILSDRETHSFIPDAFESDTELLESLRQYIEIANGVDGLIAQLERTASALSDADQTRVYLKTASLTDISRLVFGNYRVIPMAIRHHAESITFPVPETGIVTKALENKRDQFSKKDVFNLTELDSILVGYINGLEADDPLQQKIKDLKHSSKPISGHLLQAIEIARDGLPKDGKEGIGLATAIERVKPLLTLAALSKNRSLPKSEEDEGGEGYQQTQKIHEMMDAFMSIFQVVKPLHLVSGKKPIDMPDMDTGFYSDFAHIFEEYSQTTIGLYNKVRNHLTKKAFSKDKIKINFEAPTLLNGWDANKETDNASVLFEKDGAYYLGVMHPKHKKLFAYIKGINDVGSAKKLNAKEELHDKIVEPGSGGYRKVVYKLLPGANKMLPKVFFSHSRQDYFAPSDEVLRIRNTASHSKNGAPQKGFTKAEFDLKDCHTIIDFFKVSINRHPEWNEFGFKFSPTNDYEDLSGFYREVEQQGYKIDFHNIKESYVSQCVADGKIFLFQIYSKDFSQFSKGKPNLHTMYWKSLFEAENLKDVIVKLNGEAEIFYRQHSIGISEKVIHAKKEPIENKNENNPKKASIFEYDIVKDRRYTKDKFFFHVPITLNFKAPGVTRFNDLVSKHLSNSKDVHVIGLDRGERHLLYYSVINSSGVIVDQGTLNQISTDQGYQVDYHQKLHAKEKEREKARVSWSSIENIKELKQGYLSHVVHKLATLIIQYNAIVCLEDLNFGFKRGRFKIEKQVYQKFEKALIDKLNYLVFKDKKSSAPGGYLNAYQLTAPFDSFEKLGKQSGVLFYVPAAYTSKIDPATGFIDFLSPRYESLAKSKVFFDGLESFRYNSAKGYFEFTFNYKKFAPSRKLGSYKSLWTACTFGDTRYQNRLNKSNKWETVTVNVTNEIKQLFEGAGIEYDLGKDLKEEIASIKNTKFYKTLFWLLRLTLSLRHSVTGKDEDFILSPIANKDGVFFDSRQADEQSPRDADANGAYHIALKGLWNLAKIKEWDGEQRLNLAMSNEDWFSFVQLKSNLKKG